MTGEASNLGSFTPADCHQEAWELVAEGDWLAGQRFTVNRHAVLGRDSGCDITIPGTHLSRRHAELAVKGGQLLIRDLNSSNGTFVNDQRITDTVLKPGDSVRFDVLRFRVYGPAAGRQQPEDRATLVRRPEANRKPQRPKPPAEDRKWKTRPTSVGNRDKTIVMSTPRRAADYLWTALAVLVGLATVVGLAWLLTYL